MLCLPAFADTTTKLVIWHSLDGDIKEAFEEIIRDFNETSILYEVVPERAGNYPETVEKGLAAHKAGHAPHILQIYEVGTSSAMGMLDTFLPLEEIMTTFHKPFEKESFIPAIRNFYTRKDGVMTSLPWNISTGVLFYNKKAFKEAGLNPDKPPRTWEDVEPIGKALKKSNYMGFTTSWPIAYHLENLCSLHNLPFATDGNGFESGAAQLNFNGPQQIRHLQQLAKWQKEGIFHYGGRYNEEPEALFTSGKCAILFQGANRYAVLKNKADFDIGVGYLPYWASVTNEPYTLNIGGSSLWILKGFSKREYRGIAQFFAHLSSPEVQALWHQKTGYLPCTYPAYTQTKEAGFYKENPAAEIAVLEVLERKTTPNTRGIHLNNYMEVREVITDQLEKAIYSKTPAKAALDRAVEEGNQLLESKRCKPAELSKDKVAS